MAERPRRYSVGEYWTTKVQEYISRTRMPCPSKNPSKTTASASEHHLQLRALATTDLRPDRDWKTSLNTTNLKLRQGALKDVESSVCVCFLTVSYLGKLHRNSPTNMSHPESLDLLGSRCLEKAMMVFWWWWIPWYNPIKKKKITSNKSKSFGIQLQCTRLKEL